jgi:hypothetical protein
MNILIFNVENPYIIASYNFYNRHLTSKELLLIENQYFFIFYCYFKAIQIYEKCERPIVHFPSSQFIIIKNYSKSL